MSKSVSSDVITRPLKVGIIGSASDQGFIGDNELTAQALGKAVADAGWVLFYGPERQMISLPYLAARAARDAGGFTVGMAHGSARSQFHDEDAASVVVYTDTAGGAGREIVLVNSCDFVIAVGGGSGTLTEMCIAYMNFIPIIAMKGSGGWADEMAGRFLDNRKKYSVAVASDPSEALALGKQLYLKYREQPSQTSAPIFSVSGS